MTCEHTVIHRCQQVLVLAALDARASRLGISRSEYLCRRFVLEAVTTTPPVTGADLTLFAETFVELGNAEVMKGARG